MSVKFKTVKNKFPEMQERLQALNGKTLQVGVSEGAKTKDGTSYAYIASIHEYGVNIKVTDAMRAHLHKVGLHLKPETRYIRIPERAFLRTGHDKNIDKIMDKVSMLLGRVIDGKMSADKLIENIGLELVSAIKEYAVELKNPPIHPFTVDQKGSSNPLVSTSDMIESISFWVK